MTRSTGVRHCPRYQAGWIFVRRNFLIKAPAPAKSVCRLPRSAHFVWLSIRDVCNGADVGTKSGLRVSSPERNRTTRARVVRARHCLSAFITNDKFKQCQPRLVRESAETDAANGQCSRSPGVVALTQGNPMMRVCDLGSGGLQDPFEGAPEFGYRIGHLFWNRLQRSHFAATCITVSRHGLRISGVIGLQSSVPWWALPSLIMIRYRSHSSVTVEEDCWHSYLYSIAVLQGS